MRPSRQIFYTKNLGSKDKIRTFWSEITEIYVGEVVALGLLGSLELPFTNGVQGSTLVRFR
jgi:hypothetical protein